MNNINNITMLSTIFDKYYDDRQTYLMIQRVSHIVYTICSWIGSHLFSFLILSGLLCFMIREGSLTISYFFSSHIVSFSSTKYDLEERVLTGLMICFLPVILSLILYAVWYYREMTFYIP